MCGRATKERYGKQSNTACSRPCISKLGHLPKGQILSVVPVTPKSCLHRISPNGSKLGLIQIMLSPNNQSSFDGQILYSGSLAQGCSQGVILPYPELTPLPPPTHTHTNLYLSKLVLNLRNPNLFLIERFFAHVVALSDATQCANC